MSVVQKFHDLQAVAAVAHHGGVRRASLRVNLSQPAASQAILRVEKSIGEVLFTRGTRGMFPTAAGQLFVKRIDRAIGYLKAGAQAIAPRKSDRGAMTPLIERLATTVQLKALLEVIEHGGYAPAARQLGVTEPNVHRAVRDLERIAGRKLFQASPFGASPTSEALIFARFVSLAFREIDQGLDDLRELRGLRNGSVIIGSLPLLRTLILPAAVTRLLAEYPEAKVKIVDGPYPQLLDHLQHGRIDFILGALRHPAPAPDLNQEELFKEPLSIVVRSGHPVLQTKALDPAKLVDLEWIAPPPLTPAGVSFAAFFHKHGFTLPRRIIECSSFITMRDLLVRSDRAALLSASQIRHETLAGELAIAVSALPGTERPIGICTRLDWSPTQIQSVFLSLVRAIADSHQEMR
jgi:LysR family transcriptional regulator, regulator for genes of the gallate degradation pathway